MYLLSHMHTEDTEGRPSAPPFKWGIGARIALSFGILSCCMFVLVALALAGASDTAGSRQTVAAIGAVGVALCIALGLWVHTGIAKPLQGTMRTARRMASGNLSEEFEATADAEIGELQNALLQMHERMFKIVAKVRSGTTAVATTSGFITSDNAALAGRTEAQASSLQQTASSMEQLTSTVKQNADYAHQANRLVAAAASSAVNGGGVVDRVIDTMGSIKDSSRRIADIIGVIDGIAFQTNILALNAAVEAARAGEQGRGFAVVAAEVRSLAQRSATAAKEIKELIVDSVGKVNAGGELVDEAGRMMKEIVSSVKRVESIMSEIAAASSEQSTGIEEINKAMIQIDGMTQKNASLVEEAARTAASLHDQATILSHSVSIFDLGAKEYGNSDEALTMVQDAADFTRAHGEQALAADINSLSKGRFIDRDLYLSLYSLDMRCLAHGTNPRLVGVDGTNFKDAEGKLFVREIVQKAKTDESGWVDYKWLHPINREPLQKSTYFEKAGNVVIACGFYKT